MKITHHEELGEITELVDESGRRFKLDTQDWHRAQVELGSMSSGKKGYLVARIKSKPRSYGPVLIHRWIMGLEKGDPREAHHKDENKLDNRRSNLEVLARLEHNRLHHGEPAPKREVRRVLSFSVPERKLQELEGYLSHYGVDRSEFLGRMLDMALERCREDVGPK